MNEDTGNIPKTWCAAVAALLRAGKPGSVLVRRRARQDWASLPWSPFDHELLDALADTLEKGNLNGKTYTMEEPGETYGFIFYRENFPIYTKINLTNQQVVIVYSAHRPLKGEQI